MHFSARAAIALMIPAAAVTAGCAGSPSLTPVRVGYNAASSFFPYGYRDTQIAPDRYRIVVGGYATTPKPFLEKLAIVRAAEIGAEERLGYFKIESMTHSEECTPAKEGTNKSAGHGVLRRSILQAEVSYAKTPPDPSYQHAKQTFEALRPELDTDVLVPEPAATSLPATCS